MFQESEIINLILGLIGWLVLARVIERKRLPRFGFFYAGYLTLLVSYCATLIEGVFAEELFNFIEHAFLATTGVLFAIGTWKLGRHTPARTDAESSR